jgi:hypothetical protein
MALNEFRDDRRAEITRARDRLLLNVLLTATTIFVALVVAMLAGIPRETLIAITAFSIVGSLVGLANAMRLQSGIGRATDDYGLFEARLLYTLLVSGIAALGGVLLVGVSPALASVLTASAPTTSIPTLAQLFDIANPAKLLVAIGFGLVPEAFFAGVRRQVDSLRRDLESTTAAGSTSGSS